MSDQPGDRIVVHRYALTYTRDDRPGETMSLRLLARNKQAAMDSLKRTMDMRRVSGAVVSAQYVESTTARVLL